MELVGQFLIPQEATFRSEEPIRLSEGAWSDGWCASVENELQYLEAVKFILGTGVVKKDRTGTGTISKFLMTTRYDLRKSFPLFTTKKVFWKGVVEELLWFIKGDTNANHLSMKGVKIWDANTTREFLDGRGLDYAQGDIGGGYGFQWRHFGAEYSGMDKDYSGQGVDQLLECIKLIQEEPDSRRILMSSWNPVALDKMALPPCHLLAQFYISDGELSCSMYQRSCDMGLGCPFNVASYSLLVHLIAHSCGLRVGEFIHVTGDTHIYLNHVIPLREQISRTPRAGPKLVITCTPKLITEYTADDFEIIGYDPHPAIKMEMAV